jgi:hypothetical protein
MTDEAPAQRVHDCTINPVMTSPSRVHDGLTGCTTVDALDMSGSTNLISGLSSLFGRSMTTTGDCRAEE